MLIKTRIVNNLSNISVLPQNSVYDKIDSPVGKLIIIASTIGLHALLWDNESLHNYKYKIAIINFKKSSDHPIINNTKIQLNEYFNGVRKIFDLPLKVNGTDFQVQVWNELLNIPYANTISYAEQAKRIGNKNKARAVGMANGLNPISIIIPCHRVIGSNGKLVGFGGGIENKDYLLKLEKMNA